MILKQCLKLKWGRSSRTSIACNFGFRFNCVRETQILGQMRDAFFLAQDLKQLELSLIIYLNKQLLLLKAHNETDIADNAVSVSYVAVELSKSIR